MACKLLKEEIIFAGNQGIATTTAKLANNEITNTNFAIYASIERTVVTLLGTSIEKVASVGSHVQHVGQEPRSKRKKVTDVKINLKTKMLRIEIKTSSNSKSGTDHAQMVSNCADNKEGIIEGWWVIAFRKFGEKKDKICFKCDEHRRRLGTVQFWKLCGIEYEKLLSVWHAKDFIVEEMICSSNIRKK